MSKSAILVTDDPATHKYASEAETIVLTKGDLGVGFAMDGGHSSRYGDRPIIVKKIFAGKLNDLRLVVGVKV